MVVRILKHHSHHKKGEQVTVPDERGTYFIRTGVAEEVTDETEKVEVPKVKEKVEQTHIPKKKK